MFEFFDQVGQAISSAFSFLVTIIKQLFSFFQIIGTSLSFLVEVCAALPVPIQAGCLCIIAISVIYLIVGR